MIINLNSADNIPENSFSAALSPLSVSCLVNSAGVASSRFLVLSLQIKATTGQFRGCSRLETLTKWSDGAMVVSPHLFSISQGPCAAWCLVCKNYCFMYFILAFSFMWEKKIWPLAESRSVLN